MEAAVVVSASRGALGALLCKLSDLLVSKYKLLKGVRGEIMFLRAELESMYAFLERMSDAEEEPDKQGKCWMEQVRELSYNIEDSLDEFMLCIEREPNSKPHGFSGFIEKSLNFLTKANTQHRISKEFQGLKSRVMEVSERRMRYKVDDIVTKQSHTPVDLRLLSLYAETIGLVGIDGPRDELIELMMDEDSASARQLQVFSVVGFGGLGKTTLANAIYRKLEGKFQHRAIISVSQKPNIWRIFRNILSQVGFVTPEHTNMETWGQDEVIRTLQNFLTGKRYFIVIDDIWDETAWNIIKCALPETMNGSRVITTTRIDTVARVCCSNHYDYVYKMKPLTDKDSRKLIFSRVFGSEDACPSYLREVSAKILKRCGGLPLAIITVSSILASKQSKLKGQWEHVLNSLSSNFEVNHTLEGMRQILNLSYINLPHYLRTCMLYLGIYPEDYTIEKNDLVRQWVAQDFVSKLHGRDLEDVADSYFNELVNMSIIQPVDIDPNNEVLSCRVHDMMLDLIVHKCREENFITVTDDLQAMAGLPNKVRRLSLYLDGVIDDTVLGTTHLLQVRALARFGTSTYAPSLLDFKHLRVLTLEFPSGNHGPKILDLTGMSHLFQLKYLKIVACGEIALPRKIQGLEQLETLELRTSSMVEIPTDVVNLCRLLHLVIPQVTHLPSGIGNMKSLRTLREFSLGLNSVDTIRDLGDLTNLRDLQISSFGGVQLDDMEKGQRMDVLRHSLEKLCNLRYLRMDPYLPNICRDALSFMSASPCLLQRLHIWCMLSRVPKWIGELHFLYDLELVVEVLDDFGILAQLHSLLHLKLHVEGTLKDKVTICGSGFLVLNHFQNCELPKLHKLEVRFNEQYGNAPVGIEHLSGLTEFSVSNGGYNAVESSRSVSQSALRNAMDMHPCRPAAKINPCGNSQFLRCFDDDGFSWRKYGTKNVIGAKQPRSCFRCAHKHTQGCRATKRVQPTESDPLLFHVVYIGKHSCTPHPQPAQEQSSVSKGSVQGMECDSTRNYPTGDMPHRDTDYWDNCGYF
ncbi:disease resistance protein RGA5-like [Lolium rigidum]|uniref:disease resistance protein RGA5-like n=1 Tax=Lolium rigidum TaxID=89674 RepID=UPI001F5C6F29|nr:disease resistance protein RGA5-like [Lolium rigidum]